MEYIEKLKDYCSNFSKELEKECLIQIKKLQKQGFSNEWIYRAITHKDQSEWSKYGFGLLWVEHYQNQIINLLAAERNQLGDIDTDNITWDSLLEDEVKDCETLVNDNENILDNLFEKYGV